MKEWKSESLFYITFLKETGRLKGKKTPKQTEYSALRNCQEASYMCVNNNNNNWAICLDILLGYPGKSLQKRFPKSRWFDFQKERRKMSIVT